MGKSKRKFKPQPKPKNDYQKRREARDQAWLDVGEEMGIQKMADYIAIALHDPDVMGKNVYSRERIDEFMAHLSRIADHYKKAFSLDKEADYHQELLDRAQKEIYGDDMQPFNVRYPYVKEISYEKAKKGWVD